MSKEKFEDRSLSGNINVSCKYEDGTTRMWVARKEEVIDHIIDIVEDYEQQGYVLTLRQLHYQLVTKNWIINHDSAYKKLGNILDDCKYAGVIDWDNIEDRGRIPYIPYSVEGVEEALQDTVDQYRINRQKGQEVHVELWTEKDALSAILKRSTQKYHIQLVVNKGYTSSSAIYKAYQRVINSMKQQQRVVILYFGDHDPSGLDMVRDIRDRLVFMLKNGRYSSVFEGRDITNYFNVDPIGLSMQQIRNYHLPPNPTKLTDSRANEYIKRFGKTCWEVDALSPTVLTEIVEKNIKRVIDIGIFGEAIAEEKEGKAKLIDFIAKSKE